MVIDIFLTWVDDTDEKWLKERSHYKFNTPIQEEANGIERYRSWDNLQYVFRGIENCMPWVNKIFFVTCGQIPPFLNVNHPKLKIVNHKDYIPSEYLPTFKSRTIELNLFRIEELSENFILFNDDLFPLQYIEEEYFFKRGKVCDEAIERILGNGDLHYKYNQINNAWVINKYFDKKKVKRKNFFKWYYPGYGWRMVYRNLIMNYFHDFEGLRGPHEPSAMKKSVLKKLWELEPELMDTTSRIKFRDVSDVTQHLIRYWQIFEGDFYPRLHRGEYCRVYDDSYYEIASIIREKRYPIICLGEKTGQPLHKFEEAKKEINAAFEEVFPHKSSFEI